MSCNLPISLDTSVMKLTRSAGDLYGASGGGMTYPHDELEENLYSETVGRPWPESSYGHESNYHDEGQVESCGQ